MNNLLEATTLEVTVLQDVSLLLPLAFIGIGLFLMIIELTVIPGFGIAGVFGFLLMGSGLFIGVRDLTAQSMEVSTSNLTAIGAGIVAALGGCTAFSLAIFRLIPKIPGMQKLVLKENMHQPQVEQDNLDQHVLGQGGVASTDLRPSGKVDINGRTYDVVTTDGYISNGESIYVEKIQDGHLVVRRAAQG